MRNYESHSPSLSQSAHWVCRQPLKRSKKRGIHNLFITQRLGIFLRLVPSYTHQSLGALFTVVCYAHQVSSLKPSCLIKIICLGKPSYSIFNIVTENKNMTHYRVQVIRWRKWDILIDESSPYPLAFCCRKKEEQPWILWESSMPMGDVYRSLSFSASPLLSRSSVSFSLWRVYREFVRIK